MWTTSGPVRSPQWTRTSAPAACNRAIAVAVLFRRSWVSEMMPSLMVLPNCRQRVGGRLRACPPAAEVDNLGKAAARVF